MKRGFTIIELMAVISIIAILLGIVVSTASNSIKLARTQKAKAIAACVQQGLETYHAQKDEWPGTFGSKVDGDNVSSGDISDSDSYSLTPEEVRDSIRTVVEESVKGNPLMDVSGLYVSRDSGTGGKAYGMEFMEAVHGTKRSRKKMSVSEMYFGYPEKNTGHFRRLSINYSIPADSMKVVTP